MIDERAKKIIDDWCKRTKLKVEFTEKGLKIHPKLERKGAYVMELDDLSYDLPIVNKALVKYLTEGILPEETIGKCNDLKEFQKIVKISSSYKCGYHNGEYLNDRTFRVFASNDSKDSSLLKCKYPLGTMLDNRTYKGEKFANTPDHCFILNKEVNGLEVTKKVDKRWYVELAEKRLEDFGINLNDDSLF